MKNYQPTSLGALMTHLSKKYSVLTADNSTIQENPP